MDYETPVHKHQLLSLLEAVQAGKIDPGAALQRLAHLPFADIGYARVDHHRTLRLGVPEVVFGEQKSVEQIIGIARDLLAKDQNVLVTRVDETKAKAVRDQLPELKHNSVARLLRSSAETERPVFRGTVLVVTAGTSDIPIAEEACETLGMLGIPAQRLFDVGVAGIHRLMADQDAIRRAKVLIVVAGMEGALPSVVGGLVAAPVIAVPTSVGYGAALSGFAALFGMLTGCAAGVTVVNIDNGFGAAMAAFRIVRTQIEEPGLKRETVYDQHE